MIQNIFAGGGKNNYHNFEMYIVSIHDEWKVSIYLPFRLKDMFDGTKYHFCANLKK